MRDHSACLTFNYPSYRYLCGVQVLKFPKCPSMLFAKDSAYSEVIHRLL